MKQSQSTPDQLIERIEVLEKKSEEAQAIFEFLSFKHHDFRTMLSNVITIPLLLIENTNLTPEQQADMKQIHHSGNNVLWLVNNLTNLTRLEAGRMALEEVISFDIHDMMATVIQQEQKMDKYWGVSLTYQLNSKGPVMIISYEMYLYSLLFNLLKYARYLMSDPITLDINSGQVEQTDGSQMVNIVIRGQNVYRQDHKERIERVQENQAFLAKKTVTQIPILIGWDALLCKKLSDALGGTMRIEDDLETNNLTIHLQLPSDGSHFAANNGC